MKKCDCFMCNGFFIDEDEECECEANQDATPPATTRHVCKPKEYVGFSERFFFCEECGKKLEN